jgi:uncharacterized protein (DUF1330 family)
MAGLAALIPQHQDVEEDLGVEEANRFVLCLFKIKDGEKPGAMKLLSVFEETVRRSDGHIQLRSHHPSSWDIFEGIDHSVEPNHLNPAVFDFNCVILAGFKDQDAVHKWWNSDEVFEILKYRSPMEKIGLHIIEGLQESFDVLEHNRIAFGDKLILFEFVQMLAFKPVQQYVDTYKRVAHDMRKSTDFLDCNLLFSEAVCGCLMNEFPLDAACASTWRMKTDANIWYDSEPYQQILTPLRKHRANCLSVLIPMFEDKIDEYEKARKMLNKQTEQKQVLKLLNK